MNFSAGKLRALRRLSDGEGRFKMVAVDQRPPMLKALTAKLAPRVPGYEDLALAKTTLAKVLTPLGSAILIDPDYGFTSAESVLPADKGVLITLEDFNFLDAPGGRKTSLMKNWSVEKVKRMGADGVKLLLWYRPDAAADVVEHQKRLVREVGEACRVYDIPFLLEPLVYPFQGAANHTADYTEDKQKYPELVLRSLEDFADPAYGIDIYKLESPVVASDLPDPNGDSAETRAAQAYFDRIGEIIDRPWVMLSAGAGMDVFRRVLGFAYKAGANGFLAGRAIWWDAFGHFPDVQAMEAALHGKAVDYMREINAMTDAGARPWPQNPALAQGIGLQNAGHEFPSQYPGFR